jgi:BirA family biotin operon repressor/biotin-[acetyl-CoA-carboxylase] ligase
MVLRLDVPMAQAPRLPLCACAVVAAALREVIDRAVFVKWPNDLLVGESKLGGILLERQRDAVVVGIGINLVSAPKGTERPATALAHHLRGDAASPPSTEVAAAKLAEAFNVWMTRWETLGFQPILDAWRARTAGLDGPAVARLGRETIEGRAEGVGPDGALKLRLADGSLRLISAGDVFFGEAA